MVRKQKKEINAYWIDLSNARAWPKSLDDLHGFFFVCPPRYEETEVDMASHGRDPIQVGPVKNINGVD